MSGNLTIRPIARSDDNQWLPLWNGYNAFHDRAGPTALDPEITRTTWQRFFDAYEPVHALVAESDGRVLGLVHYLFHAARQRFSQTAICRTCSPRRTRAARASGAP